MLRKPCRLQSGMQRAVKLQQSTRRKSIKAFQQTPGGQMLIFVPPHPLIQHYLSICRNIQTPVPAFRVAVSELGRLLAYEATKDCVPVQEDIAVQTPCGIAQGTMIDITSPVLVVPVLRAGMLMTEQLNSVLPVQEVAHVGYERDESTLKASQYLNKVPESIDPDRLVLVFDTMIATGGTMEQVIEMLLARGAKQENIKVLCVLVGAPALSVMAPKYKGLRIYSACIDEVVNDKGFIVPGLGDAGDRGYGTDGEFEKFHQMMQGVAEGLPDFVGEGKVM